MGAKSVAMNPMHVDPSATPFVEPMGGPGTSMEMSTSWGPPPFVPWESLAPHTKPTIELPSAMQSPELSSAFVFKPEIELPSAMQPPELSSASVSKPEIELPSAMQPSELSSASVSKPEIELPSAMQPPELSSAFVSKPEIELPSAMQPSELSSASVSKPEIELPSAMQPPELSSASVSKPKIELPSAMQPPELSSASVSKPEIELPLGLFPSASALGFFPSVEGSPASFRILEQGRTPLVVLSFCSSEASAIASPTSTPPTLLRCMAPTCPPCRRGRGTEASISFPSSTLTPWAILAPRPMAASFSK